MGRVGNRSSEQRHSNLIHAGRGTPTSTMTQSVANECALEQRASVHYHQSQLCFHYNGRIANIHRQIFIFPFCVTCADNMTSFSMIPSCDAAHTSSSLACSFTEALFDMCTGPYDFILITNEPDGRARVRLNGVTPVAGINKILYVGRNRHLVPSMTTLFRAPRIQSPRSVGVKNGGVTLNPKP